MPFRGNGPMARPQGGVSFRGNGPMKQPMNPPPKLQPQMSQGVSAPQQMQPQMRQAHMLRGRMR